jgi:hypothetical protein
MHKCDFCQFEETNLKNEFKKKVNYKEKDLFKRMAETIGNFLENPSTAQCNDICTHIIMFLVWIDSFV